MYKLINLDKYSLNKLKTINYIRSINGNYKSKTMNTILNKKIGYLDNMNDLFTAIQSELNRINISPIVDTDDIINEFSHLDIMDDLIEIYEDCDEDYVSYYDSLYSVAYKYMDFLEEEEIDYNPNYNYTNSEVLQIIYDIKNSNLYINTGINLYDDFYESLREDVYSTILQSYTLYLSSPNLDDILKPLYNKSCSDLENNDIFKALSFIGLSTGRLNSFRIAYSDIIHDCDFKKASDYNLGEYMLIINAIPHGEHFFDRNIRANSNRKLIEDITHILKLLENPTLK